MYLQQFMWIEVRSMLRMKLKNTHSTEQLHITVIYKSKIILYLMVNILHW